ncbi:MAG TPA: hypothetical protein VFP36_07215, partial [Usitatibacter sp.]|nr:hypothetical protein [Usitatibacter sp.]
MSIKVILRRAPAAPYDPLTPGVAHRETRDAKAASNNSGGSHTMKSLAAAFAAGAAVLATGVGAETLLSHTPVPGTTFTDALSAQDLAIEAMMNTAADGTKS